MKFFLEILVVRLLSFVNSKDLLLFVEKTSWKVKVCKQIRNNKILKIKEIFKYSVNLFIIKIC